MLLQVADSGLLWNVVGAFFCSPHLIQKGFHQICRAHTSFWLEAFLRLTFLPKHSLHWPHIVTPLFEPPVGHHELAMLSTLKHLVQGLGVVTCMSWRPLSCMVLAAPGLDNAQLTWRATRPPEAHVAQQTGPSFLSTALGVHHAVLSTQRTKVLAGSGAHCLLIVAS